jgi:hypothetical protein
MAQWDLSEYRYLWLPDDDLDIAPDSIDTMFRVAERYKYDPRPLCLIAVHSFSPTGTHGCTTETLTPPSP